MRQSADVRRRPVSTGPLRVIKARRAPFRPDVARPEPSSRESVAFVFQGGGSLAATQVGMLRALTEAGVRPDFVIGTSAGALNAVMFATDPTTAGLNRLEAVWTSLHRRAVAPLSPATLARAVTGRGPSLVSDRGLRQLVLANVTITRLDEAVVPVLVVATDLTSGEPVVLQHAAVVDSLLASSAFPGLYPPVTLAGRTLIDGGVCADVPVLQAEQHGASICYVLPCAAQISSKHAHPGAMPLAFHALNHILEMNSHHDILAARSTVHVLPVPATAAAHPVDFRDTDRLIAQSYRLAREELSLLGSGVGAIRT